MNLVLLLFSFPTILNPHLPYKLNSVRVEMIFIELEVILHGIYTTETRDKRVQWFGQDIHNQY